MSCLSTYHPVKPSGLHEGCFNPELVPLHGNALSELYNGPVHLERIFKDRTGGLRGRLTTRSPAKSYS